MEKIMQWQPIETLPDPDAEYLFYAPDDEGSGSYAMIFVGVLGDVLDEDEITHWMPLPEPPK